MTYVQYCPGHFLSLTPMFEFDFYLFVLKHPTPWKIGKLSIDNVSSLSMSSEVFPEVEDNELIIIIHFLLLSVV